MSQNHTTALDQQALPLPLNADDPHFAAHLEGLTSEELLIRQCDNCSEKQWPPRPFCRHCQSQDFTWIDAPRTGTVASYSIAHRAFHPAYVGHLPAATVLVDLEPGIRIAGRWVGDITDIEIGGRADLTTDDWSQRGVSSAWNVPEA